MPLTVIAAYALFLRVQQYGWTVDRITVAAVLVVALSYAGGYAHAAVIKGEWLASLPRWNFAISLLVLALIVSAIHADREPAADRGERSGGAVAQRRDQSREIRLSLSA